LRTSSFQWIPRSFRSSARRLVGQSHIALAELIKNSYDADATRVEVTVRPDSIVVSDDGHGMDFRFQELLDADRSKHKDERDVSPEAGD